MYMDETLSHIGAQYIECLATTLSASYLGCERVGNYLAKDAS